MTTKIKICGITNIEDARAAVEYGADAIGFVFYKKSSRYIEVEKAQKIISLLPPFISTVVVFVNESYKNIERVIDKCHLNILQLHGNEDKNFCTRFSLTVIKSIKIKDEKSLENMERFKVSAFLLDSFSENIPGGTGKSFDWDLAVRAKKYGNIILAGGLTAENVKDAISKVKPYGVDVSSGVEIKPGKKDHEKMRRFIEEAKRIK